MSQPIDLRPELVGWADNVLRLFDQKVRALGIHEGRLLSSFESHVYWHSGGDLNKVQFAFEYYGRFVDWGVGRGVTAKERSNLVALGLTKRRKKPWFSTVFYKQIPQLRQIIEERLANTLPLIVTQNIEDNADFGRTPMQV